MSLLCIVEICLLFITWTVVASLSYGDLMQRCRGGVIQVCIDTCACLVLPWLALLSSGVRQPSGLAC